MKTWLKVIAKLFDQGLDKEDIIEMGYPKQWVEDALSIYLESTEEEYEGYFEQ